MNPSAPTNPQADNILDSDRPLKDLIPLFPDKIAAYGYYAQYMTRRFATADPHCADCGRQCDDPPSAFTWRANLHTTKTVLLTFLFNLVALLASSIYSRWMVVQFTTFHRLCPQCQHRHRNHGIIAAVLEKVLFAALILLLILAVPAVIFSFALPFIDPKATWVALAGAAVGIGLLTLVVRGFEACRKLLIPPALRRIGRPPFFLLTLSKTA
jgi:hypothetical protein